MIRRGKEAARSIQAALAEPRARGLPAEEGAKMAGRKLRLIIFSDNRGVSKDCDY